MQFKFRDRFTPVKTKKKKLSPFDKVKPHNISELKAGKGPDWVHTQYVPHGLGRLIWVSINGCYMLEGYFLEAQATGYGR